MSTEADNRGKKHDHGAVPPAVRRQAEAAAKLQEQTIAAARGEQQQPQPETPPQPQPDPAPQPPPQPDPAPQPQAEQHADPGKPNYEQLEHMFRSEQGRARRFERQFNDVQGQLEEMRNLIASMRQPAQPEPAQQTPAKVEWSEDEIREWGEALPVIEKKVKEIVGPIEMHFRDLVGQVQNNVKTVATATAQNARQKMMEILDGDTSLRTAPDRSWREINIEDEFVDWLSYPDPLTGAIRHEILKDAWERNDASRVAAFFRSYLKDAAAVAPRPQPAPAPAPAQPLEKFAAPGKPRTAAPASNGDAGPEIITSGDIARFYRDRQLGRWKGREDEAKAYEAKIFAAQRDNRIVPGNPQP